MSNNKNNETTSVKLEKRKAASGDTILYVNKNPIQDIKDPAKFCYNFIKNNKAEKEISTVIVFGHDFGYTADAILKVHPKIKYLFIYEPIDEVFNVCVPEREDLFANPKIYISNSLNMFITQFEGLYSQEEGLAIYTAPNWPQYFEVPFKEFIETLQRRLSILRNSPEDEFKTLLKNEAENIFRNLPKHTANPDIQELQHKGYKKPVLICSGGPSLKNSVEDLKGLEDKIILISTEDSFKILTDKGIKPHLVISSSTEKDILKKFNKETLKDTALITPLTSYYKLQKLPFLSTFTFIALRSVYKPWIFEKLKESFSFDAGVSEECTAFSLGIILGGSPVALLGFDSLKEDSITEQWLEASHVTLKKELKHTADLWNLSGTNIKGYANKTLKDVIDYSETVVKHSILDRIKDAKNLPWEATLLADTILEIAKHVEDKNYSVLRSIPLYNYFMGKNTKEEEFIKLLQEISKELDVYFEEK